MFKAVKRMHVSYGILHIFLIAFAVLTLFPFLWMVSTSLKTDSSIFVFPPALIPEVFQWGNYAEVFQKQDMLSGLLNSTKIAVINTVGTLFFASLAAYAFAKLKFRFSNALFMILIATMMIPGQVTLIPMFITFKNIGWYDTHMPLMIPSILCNAYGVFLLRQFFTSIPDAYSDSAYIDGCSRFRIYWSIMLPLCVPALVTLGLFNFMATWNNFLTPLIYLNSYSKYTIPLVVMSFKNLYSAHWSLLMAASCVALVPVIALYMFTQRYFISGIMIGGIKG